MERIAVPAEHRRSLRRPKRLLALRSDERLVDHVRAGDDGAFEVLYERHVAGLLGFCRHMLGTPHEAEDAVQQAFVSAHGAMLRGSREIAFKPWLYTIARNRCVSMLRARRELAVEAPEPEPSTAGLHEEVAQRADLRELVGDVQRLPDDQRAALVLSELGDLSHAEIAAVLGCEVDTVKGIVFRARSALIERHDARQADCGDIREELMDATGGALRRSRLRYHLEGCPGCVTYLEELRRQRKLLGVALPAVPTLALHDSVMASVGIGGASAAVAAGGAAAGGAATAGVPLLGGTAAKVAVGLVLAAGGAGVATEVARDEGRSSEPADQSSESAPREPGASEGGAGAVAPISAERSRGARGDERRTAGQRRSQERSGGKSRAGEARGKALGRSEAAPGLRRGQADGNPGRGAEKRAVPPGASGGGSGSNGSGRGKPSSAPSEGSPPARQAPERGPPAEVGSALPTPSGKGKGASGK